MSNPHRILGEEDIIASLHEHFPHRRELTSCDIGDDTTILAESWNLLTCDTMCEGVHFDLELASHADAAYRCLAANLSDIAAMGGVPGPFTLSLALPKPGLQAHHTHLIGQGLRACLADHNVEHAWLVGGDVVRSPAGIILTITLLGRPALPDVVLRRSDAAPDDTVAVFRPLGAAAAGLALLQRKAKTPYEALTAAHLRPGVDAALGPALASAQCIHAAMDLSDGLARDLPKLAAASGVGITIDVDHVPRHPQLAAAAAYLGLSTRELVLGGGEDYTLCVTYPGHAHETVARVASKQGVELHRIGVVHEGEGVTFHEHGEPLDVNALGFRHF